MGREKSGETDKHEREKHGEKRVRRQESEEIKLGRQEGVNRRERQEWGERSVGREKWVGRREGVELDKSWSTRGNRQDLRDKRE